MAWTNAATPLPYCSHMYWREYISTYATFDWIKNNNIFPSYGILGTATKRMKPACTWMKWRIMSYSEQSNLLSQLAINVYSGQQSMRERSLLQETSISHCDAAPHLHGLHVSVIFKTVALVYTNKKPEKKENVVAHDRTIIFCCLDSLLLSDVEHKRTATYPISTRSWSWVFG